MIEVNRNYWNPSNGRHYRLELQKDLTDTWVVNRFYGSHRLIEVLPDYQTAILFFDTEHRRRISRNYRCTD